MNGSEQFVRMIAGNFASPPLSFEVLAKAGQAFPKRAAQQPPLGRMKECFKNASHLSAEEGLYYVEGYAMPGGMVDMALEHAWCVNEAGEVFDPTWRDGHDYFGMAFDHIALIELLEHTGTYCILGNLYLFHKLGVDTIRQMLLEAAYPIQLETA